MLTFGAKSMLSALANVSYKRTDGLNSSGF